MDIEEQEQWNKWLFKSYNTEYTLFSNRNVNYLDVEFTSTSDYASNFTLDWSSMRIVDWDGLLCRAARTPGRIILIVIAKHRGYYAHNEDATIEIYQYGFKNSRRIYK